MPFEASFQVYIDARNLECHVVSEGLMSLKWRKSVVERYSTEFLCRIFEVGRYVDEDAYSRSRHLFVRAFSKLAASSMIMRAFSKTMQKCRYLSSLSHNKGIIRVLTTGISFSPAHLIFMKCIDPMYARNLDYPVVATQKTRIKNQARPRSIRCPSSHVRPFSLRVKCCLYHRPSR